ncbi:hypothetical protein M0638_07185 [Roseomonas sp. NAR14]|uniref:Uncharacterized protein n=1 Tax=Roseomonas acroporae TaxID=2937791 RepID=A0A9X1Y639_9PROT|nr:hypothetical protein [Roseomonas acroporae]MCK8784158.1 hypothetical protein [Roseomonas acroporae]
MPDLDSREVDALIRRLIACREAMLPPISRGDPAPGTAVLTSNEMRWWVEPSPVPGHVTFCLLHPGLGWIGQHITPGAVDRLVTEIRQAGTRETRTTRPR